MKRNIPITNGKLIKLHCRQNMYKII